MQRKIWNDKMHDRPEKELTEKDGHRVPQHCHAGPSIERPQEVSIINPDYARQRGEVVFRSDGQESIRPDAQSPPH